jgi:hypothetical protein
MVDYLLCPICELGDFKHHEYKGIKCIKCQHCGNTMKIREGLKW